MSYLKFHSYSNFRKIVRFINLDQTLSLKRSVTVVCNFHKCNIYKMIKALSSEIELSARR